MIHTKLLLISFSLSLFATVVSVYGKVCLITTPSHFHFHLFHYYYKQSNTTTRTYIRHSTKVHIHTWSPQTTITNWNFFLRPMARFSHFIIGLKASHCNATIYIYRVHMICPYPLNHVDSHLWGYTETGWEKVIGTWHCQNANDEYQKLNK